MKLKFPKCLKIKFMKSLDEIMSGLPDTPMRKKDSDAKNAKLDEEIRKIVRSNRTWITKHPQCVKRTVICQKPNWMKK